MAPGKSPPPVSTPLIRNSRGQQLCGHVLKPAGRGKKAQATGVLVFHHGLTEHCSRHLHVLQQIVDELRLVVVTYDFHGHGRSEPLEPENRALVESYTHLVDDLLLVVDQVAIPTGATLGAPPSKLFLAGHSIGGMTSILAAAARPNAFAGLLLSSPLVSVQPKNSWGEWAQIGALRILNQIAPKRPYLKRRPQEAGIRCKESLAACLTDELWNREPLKVRTVVTCINGTQQVQRCISQVKVPLFLQQGVDDMTCSVIALRSLLPCFGSTSVTYNEIPGGLHDLFHDPETPECVARKIGWLSTQLAA